MIEREREELILRILRTDRFVSVSDVVKVTGASEATVRRDFSRLEDRGLIRRIRGGAEYLPEGDAVPAMSRASVGTAVGGDSVEGLESAGGVAVGVRRRSFHEQSLAERVGLQTEYKRRIARRAAEYCQDGDTVLIDGGSTTLFLADYLMESQVTVVTNSFAIADRLRRSCCAQIFLPGGRLDPDSMLIQDPTGRDFYQDYAATSAFLGVEGIDERGLTNTDMEVVHSQRQMMAHAKQVVVLADSSKFGAGGHLRASGFDEISVLVTDEKPPEPIRNALDAHGVELVVASY